MSKTIYLTLGCNVETNRVFENRMFITDVKKIGKTRVFYSI